MPGTLIAFGQTSTGVIDGAAPQNTYTFAANSGDRVLVRIQRTSGNLAPAIRVHGPDGAQICEAWDWAAAETSACELPGSGTYTVLAFAARSDSPTGAYQLAVQRLNNPGTARPLVFGQTVAGAIDQTALLNTYTFAANAGDRVLVRIQRTSGNLAPAIRVHGPDGAQICEAWDWAAAETGACELPGSGTYTVLAFAARADSPTGAYQLAVQRLNNPGTARPVVFGQTVASAIDQTALLNTYTFVANAGDRVLVRIQRTSGNLAPAIRVHGPDGAQICEAWDWAAAETGACELPGSSTYTVLAFAARADSPTGAYQLAVQRLNNPGTARPLVFNQTVAGAIDETALLNTYTFAANAGDRVLVRIQRTSGNLAPAIRVHGPDGAQICEAWDWAAAETGACELPGSGTYTVLAFAARADSPTGAYQLTVQRLPG